MRKTKSKNKLVALLLTAFVASASAGVLTACSKKSDKPKVDQSEISTDQTTDVSRIKNGSFEFDAAKETTPIVTSPKSWSRSSVLTSKAASGVIDTETSAWDKLTKTGGITPANESEAESKWSEMNVYDRLQYIKTWKESNKNKSVDDLKFYKDHYNISADDIPANDVNPGTHYTESDVAAGKNTKVLMIRNKYTSSSGTAQSFTSSSSLTLPAGTSAKVSLWVKTSQLTYYYHNGEKQSENQDLAVLKNRGAYIGISRTVAGKSKDQVLVKNIDTEKISAENKSNGWVKYEFYLQGSEYASSTFTMVLGLGQGTSSSTMGFVNGYAFFDDVECSIIENAAYDVLANNADAKVTENNAEFRADENINYLKYAVPSGVALNSVTLDDLFGSNEISAIEADNNKDFDTTNDRKGIFAKDSVNLENENAYFKAVWESDFASSYPFAETNEILMLFSAGKTAYEISTEPITLKANSSALFSVWVKTSKIPSGATGAGISYTETQIDGTPVSSKDEDKKKSLLSSLNSTTGTKTEVDDKDSETGKKEDIFDGWQQCTLLIGNETDDEKYFTLTFTYGAKEKSAEKSAYGAGYAAFTNFRAIGSNIGSDTDPFTQSEYFSSGTYAAKPEPFSNDEKDAGFAAFDSRKYDASNQLKGIENGFAALANYKGVWGGSSLVASKPDSSVSNNIDDNDYAGLVNKEYATSATVPATSKYKELASIFTAPETFDRSAEPLMIYNKEAHKSYGFIAKSNTTIAADSYKTISVRVRTMGNATASVYLIDADKSGSSLALSTPQISYWYDKTGNVCAKDPGGENFKPSTDTALYLNSRGLYEVNPKWLNESDLQGRYYANLSAYTEKVESGEWTGSLKVSNGGVQYNYDASKWDVEGKDGIAFYHKQGDAEGVYYADRACTVRVYDLKELLPKGLAARTQASEQQGEASLEYTGINTSGKWETYTFYIHTGSEAKNYRLEVWSGTRDNQGVVLEEGSYVMFAADNRTELTSDTWGSMLKETLKKAQNGNADFYKSANVRYYAFSFLDSAKFLRYDSAFDTDDIGNAYTSYDSTSYAYKANFDHMEKMSDYVAYLAYTNETPGEKENIRFADYSKTDVSVTADANDKDNSDSDDSDDKSSSGMNGWLLASSIILAAVLLLAIVSLAVQRIVRKKNRTKAPKTAKPSKK